MVSARYKEVMGDNANLRVHPTTDSLPDIEIPDQDHDINLVPDIMDVYYNKADLPCLTNSERNILSTFMRDGYQGIATTLGLSRRSAVEKVSIIKKKLRAWLDEQSLGN
jgi:dimeric dUTPase (all-alpha-NTP-PPase superfamily)